MQGTEKKFRTLGIAIAVNSLLFAAAYAVYTPRFVTNDDPAMMLQAAGISRVVEPSEHLLFTNVLIGKMLKALYTLNPRVVWYTIYLVATLFAAHVALFAAALAAPLPGALAVYLLYFVLIGIHLLLNLQFTTVACLAALAGFVLLLAERSHPLRATAAAGLILWGSLIRWDAFALAAALAFPFWALRAIELVPRRAVANAFVLTLSLLAAVAAMQAGQTLRAREPGGREFMRFYPLLCRLVDDRILDVSAPAQRMVILESVGWSSNDYAMLSSYCFADPAVYNRDSFARIIAAAPAWKRNVWAVQALKVIFGILREDFVRNALLLAALSLTVFPGSRRRVWKALAVLGMPLVLLAYLVWFRRPPPPRVYWPMFAFVAWGAVLRFADTGSLRPACRKLRLVLGFLLVLLLGIQARRAFASYRWQTRENREHNRLLHATLERLSPRPEELYVIWGAAFPWPWLSPFESPDFLETFNTFCFDDGQQTPSSRRMLERFGITNIFTALPDRRDVLLVIRDRKCLDLYATYMREHHGMIVRPQGVFTSEYFEAYTFQREMAPMPWGAASPGRETFE